MVLAKKMSREDWLLIIVNAALKAGKEILSVYHADFMVEHKDDHSPLTEADKRAHLVISEVLSVTGIPILSEEGNLPDFSERKKWKQFWMVDPLDGTKEFVKRNGEFTVNIALIEDGKPTMGVIYIPVTKELYFAYDKAYKVENSTLKVETLSELINVSQQLPLPQKRANYIVVASRSHLSRETSSFINEQKHNHKKVETLSKGSSLKLCMIAEGTADVYPRFSPTMEWDIAAGQAIANAAGAKVVNWNTKETMRYNKENLLNSWFVAKR